MTVSNPIGTDDPTAVYRLYDEAGSLLYVGISKHPEKRFVEHEQLQFWWHEVSETVITWYDSREEAKEAEDDAILTENPRHDRTWRMSGSLARRHGVTRTVEIDHEKDRVAAALAEAIQRGEYQIGDRLPDNRGVAEQFGVSLRTAKAAIWALMETGLVCNLSLAVGYPVTVVRQSPTGRQAIREEFLHLAGARRGRRAVKVSPPRARME